MKNKFFLALVWYISTPFVQAQTNVTVIVKNHENALVAGATAELLRNPDSVLIKVAITDEEGLIVFENIRDGQYFIRVSTVNYQTGFSVVFFLSANQPEKKLSVILFRQKTGDELKGVTVSAQKPFIQRLNDRTVVNVENSIVNAGSNAIDILERSPGVTISSNDVISMRGKAGVIVMIDGKQTVMSGEELVNYLRSVPSAVIQQIDLITNPSSKYDAAGNAGIIDIRLKKNQKLGTNGTLTGGFGQGIYPKANAGLTFNNRGKKTNFYGNANYNFVSWLNHLLLRRDFYESGNYAGSYDQDNYIRRIYPVTSGRLGFDYYMSQKSILGVVVSSNTYDAKRTATNHSFVLDPRQLVASSFITEADSRENNRNYVTNLNFKHSFDSSGREFSIDADYARFVQDWAGNYLSKYYDKNGNPLQPPYLLGNEQDGLLQIKTIKADYTCPIKKRLKIESGIKASMVTADNNVLFFDQSNLPALIDSSKSNHFLYKENINAFYVNLKRQFGKLELQAGVRGEATRLETTQLFFNINYDTSYFQLFPSAFISYQIKKNQLLTLAISRRIDRPAYGQVNPFRIFVDPSFYVSGDPNLRPQTTWSCEMGYTFKQLNFGLSYSHTRDLLTYVLMPTANRVTLQTAVNFESGDYIGLTIAAPIKMTKWWNSINNINLFYNSFKGFTAETTVDAAYLNTIVSTNNSFDLSKAWTGEINFSLNTGNKNGVMMDLPAYALSAGLQKGLWNNKATVRFAVTDILWRTWPRFKSRYTTYRENLLAIRDTRVANLSLTYRFGSNKVQAVRRRATASEEERKRAGGN